MQSATIQAPAQPLVTLRMADLTKKLSASRGTIYDLLNDKANPFPTGFTYGGRGVYYFEHEVDLWLLRQREQNPVKPVLPH